jgi:hypothetical protein
MTVSRRRRDVLIAAACVHLALVICGAAGFVPIPAKYAAGRVLTAYGDYSGANNAYGFFAPSVASEWRTTFTVCDGEKHCADVEQQRPNAEGEVLLTTIDALYAEPEVRDLLAASWAAAAFGRYPSAHTILVKGSVFDVPPMAVYRRGRRAQWKNVYGYAFSRRR